jgi:hypothetical protein
VLDLVVLGLVALGLHVGRHRRIEVSSLPNASSDAVRGSASLGRSSVMPGSGPPVEN